jgi:hypothetical protein
MHGVNRRDFLASGAMAAGAALLPAPVFAQPLGLDARSLRILEIARREVQRAGPLLAHRDVVGVLDFGIHSADQRFHFADLDNGRVRSFRVAHGSGSDPEGDGWLKRFSNVPGSDATSRGAYITWEVYNGKYGPSVRLGGLDPENSRVLDRAVVMHPADYCTEAHVQEYGRLGRSNGCFAMSPADFPYALDRLSGGRLLYADSLSLGPSGERASNGRTPLSARYG